MYKIMVEWLNGSIEEVDSSDVEFEAIDLVSEYRMAFHGSYNRVWVQF
jgi:hypothetical protein